MAADSPVPVSTPGSYKIDDYVLDGPSKHVPDHISDPLREQGLQLAYQKNPDLKKFVEGTQRLDLSTKELGAAELSILGGAIANEFRSELGWVGFAIGLGLAVKSGWDELNARQDIHEAKENLKGEQYAGLIQAQEDLSRDKGLMTHGHAASFAVTVGARAFGRPLTGFAQNAVLYSPFALDAAGFALSRNDVDKFDDHLDALARASIMEKNAERK